MFNKEKGLDLHNVDNMISVIMPCYNAQSFVGEAIESVIEQSWKNLELIVIDDGSQDLSSQVVKKWAEKDDRIIFFTNEKNVGVSETRNRGIELSKGEWIAFLDSDDVWEKDKLEKQMALAVDRKADFVFSSCSMIDEKNRYIGEMSRVPIQANYRELQRWNMITCSSVLVKRELLGECRFKQDDSREDYILWLRLLRKSSFAYAVREPLVRWRIVSGSRSSNKIKMIPDTIRVHRILGEGVLSSIYFTFSHFFFAYLYKYLNIRIAKY